MNQKVFDDELSRQGGNRQIEPLQSAGRNAEDHPNSGGNETGSGNGYEHRHVEGGCENCPRIGSDSEEGAMAKGDLPCKADQNIETDGGDRRNPYHVEDIHHIGIGQQRQ